MKGYFPSLRDLNENLNDKLAEVAELKQEREALIDENKKLAEQVKKLEAQNKKLSSNLASAKVHLKKLGTMPTQGYVAPVKLSRNW